MCGLFPHIKQFSNSLDTNWVSLQFNYDINCPEWAQTPQIKGSVPQQDCPPTVDAACKSQVAICTSDQPATNQGFPQPQPLLGFSNFLEQHTGLRKQLPLQFIWKAIMKENDKEPDEEVLGQELCPWGIRVHHHRGTWMCPPAQINSAIYLEWRRKMTWILEQGCPIESFMIMEIIFIIQY